MPGPTVRCRDAAGGLLVCSSRLRWARSVSTRRISSRAAVIRARAASVSTTGRGVWSMLAAATQPPAFFGAVSGGDQDSRRNRLARNAPGLAMWSGQVVPRARMSALRASLTARADHTTGSTPTPVSASQMAPMWARSRPWVIATSPAASFWVASGRAVARRGRAWRVLSQHRLAGALARTLGE